ncbi:MAG: potassium-transporting ATPase subunit KdpC [candidate division Zixibacteria bacterium]|nr:potassium-transporting ATPase subunit KdpC [candidate division Zixibacteria bacterium]
MMQMFKTALRVLLVLTVLTGIIYPLVITGVVQLLFPGRANGSLVRRGDQTIGSALVGQDFSDYRYFWPRPSATNYNAMPSGAANLGPTSQQLRTLTDARRARMQQSPHEPGRPLPWDMASASGSGLDPDISAEAAQYQVTRIAMARALDSLAVSRVMELIGIHTMAPTFGVLGEPRVNVLALNLALDSLEAERK